MRCHAAPYLGGDFGRMVFKYEPFEVQDPHALVLLRFSLRAEHEATQGRSFQTHIERGLRG